MQVVVNAAESVDGKLAARDREQLAISGSEDFARVDRLRASSDAVMVGVGTVHSDDPSLTLDDDSLVASRTEAGRSPHPARVVVDSRARTPLEADVLDETAETFVLVSEAAPAERRSALERVGATVIVEGTDRVDLSAALADLEDEGVTSLMVEGGGELIFSLFAADLVDELRVYVGSMIVGGRDAPTLADGEGFAGDYPSLQLRTVERLDDGVVLEYDVAEADREK